MIEILDEDDIRPGIKLKNERWRADLHEQDHQQHCRHVNPQESSPGGNSALVRGKNRQQKDRDYRRYSEEHEIKAQALKENGQQCPGRHDPVPLPNDQHKARQRQDGDEAPRECIQGQ